MFNLIILSIAFGVFTKLADLFNEHGYKEPFRGVSLLAGIMWGIIGALLLSINDFLHIFYTSIIFYWLLSNKLEYKNHAIGGVIMLIVSFRRSTTCLSEHTYQIGVLLFSYEMTRYLFYKIKQKSSSRVLSLRLFLIPLIYSAYVNDYSVFFASCLAIFGVKLTNLAVRSFNLLSQET